MILNNRKLCYYYHMPKTIDISDNQGKKVEEAQEEKAVLESNDEVKEKVEKPTTKEKKQSSVFKKINWKSFIFPVVAILTLVGIGSFYYFGIYKLKPQPLSEVFSFDEMFLVSSPNESLFDFELPLLSKPEEPRTEESPLNGLLFSKSEMDEMLGRRPVAVMINNHVKARPLSGLNSADIVIEANAESGITRHLAIFWSKSPEKVGPVRSLRQYYLEWLSAYDPILIHDGCAQTDDPRTNACGNTYIYGIKDIATYGAWRTYDNGRVAPHNEYSSIQTAWDYAETMGWDDFPNSIDSLEFKRDAAIEERGDKTIVKTVFHTRLTNDNLYDALWTYDPSTNSYFRKVGGQADMDAETNTQVNAKVVIIQEIKVVPSGDDKGRLIITTVDDGDAVILQDGQIINATWEKDSRTDRNKYYDSSGNPIQFNRGRIWISMIPHNDGKFDIIDQ